MTGGQRGPKAIVDHGLWRQYASRITDHAPGDHKFGSTESGCAGMASLTLDVVGKGLVAQGGQPASQRGTGRRTANKVFVSLLGDTLRYPNQWRKPLDATKYV